ncbi:YkgJ family cysteine cluster protein [Lentisphaerota bacterium WC36G]|nr:YkgJ family cysteine cluster protein [Lentisphaerae bacterium WC36]
MKNIKIDVDKNLKFSCSSCGACCRHWLVPVTLAEKERIESLDLPNYDFENSAPEEYFTKLTKSLYTINKKSDGSCVFLDDKNLCIIHSLYGEEYKSLACRLYPLDIFEWKDNTVSATLKFRCQSVKCTQNDNNNDKVALHKQKKKILSFAKEVNSSADGIYSEKVPASLEKIRFIQQAVLKILNYQKLPLKIRLYSIAKIIDFHDSKKMATAIENANELFIDDAFNFIKKAHSELTEEYNKITKNETVDVNNRIRLRFMLCNYARTDENVTEKSARQRIANSFLHFKFSAGLATLHDLSSEYPQTNSKDYLKTALNCTLSEKAEELLFNYLNSRLISGHFFSQPCLNLNFIQGIKHFLLSTVIINILAAIFNNATKNEDNNIISKKALRKSLSVIDRTFSASDVFKFSGMKFTEERLSKHKTYAIILENYGCFKK